MTNKDLARLFGNNSDNDRANHFARYDKEGRLQSESPKSSHDVATKTYVDNAVAAASNGEAGDYEHVHDFLTITHISHNEDANGDIVLEFENDAKVCVPIVGSDYVSVDVAEDGKHIVVKLDENLVDAMLFTKFVELTNSTQVDELAVPAMTVEEANYLYSMYVAGRLAGIQWLENHLSIMAASKSSSEYKLTILVGAKLVQYAWSATSTPTPTVLS